jgi:hypothetical protein
MPRLSIIQNNIKEPISGVTIIGRRDTKITSPFTLSLSAFTPSAIIRPKAISNGVTVKVNVRVKAIAR